MTRHLTGACLKDGSFVQAEKEKILKLDMANTVIVRRRSPRLRHDYTFSGPLPLRQRLFRIRLRRLQCRCQRFSWLQYAVRQPNLLRAI
jgi:hypothetical protein